MHPRLATAHYSSNNRKMQHMKNPSPPVAVPDEPPQIEGRVARLLLDMIRSHWGDIDATKAGGSVHAS